MRFRPGGGTTAASELNHPELTQGQRSQQIRCQRTFSNNDGGQPPEHQTNRFWSGVDGDSYSLDVHLEGGGDVGGVLLVPAAVEAFGVGVGPTGDRGLSGRSCRHTTKHWCYRRRRWTGPGWTPDPASSSCSGFQDPQPRSEVGVVLSAQNVTKNKTQMIVRNLRSFYAN